MDGLECGGYYFYSNFDSGNLSSAECIPVADVDIQPNITGKIDIPDVEFNLRTKPDCAGTEFANGNRTWFYFGIKGSIPCQLVKFNIIDLNKQAKLYSQGMGPVYKIIPGRPHWERIYDKPTFSNDNNVFTLSFKFRIPENIQNIIYLAFTYPYSYTDLQHKLDLVDKRFRNDILLSKDDIYYVRECVCHSLQGRKTDLLTISSFHNITTERETRLKNLFPDNNVPRPYRFSNKKFIFVSARVHPGETPSSFVLNGFLNLLLNRDDPIAVILRKNYVFKVIPCLNPDGVVNGHYRTDTRGVNLNRVYLNPQFKDHPTIYAARALIKYYHNGFENEDTEWEDVSQSENLLNEVSHMTLDDKNKKNGVYWCNRCNINFIVNPEPQIITTLNHNKITCSHCGNPVEINDNSLTQGDRATIPESGLFLYLDMHGHASKKGIFMYGNHFDDVESSIKCMLLPKIMSLNNHNFHFTACNFTERNMYLRDKRDGMSKEGSGRVAVYKLTGLVQSYTLECNYNTGRLVNILPPTIKDTSKILQNIMVPPKYTPHIFEDVGKAIGTSILDLTSDNPYTRLPHSEYHSLNGLKDWLRHYCNDIGEVHKSPNRAKIRHTASLHAQGKAVRSVIVKTRSLSKYTPKKVNLKQLRAQKHTKKEKIPPIESLSPQPSCSYSQSALSLRSKGIKATKSLNMHQKMKKDNNPPPEKQAVSSATNGVNHIAKNIQNASTNIKSKFKLDSKINTTKKVEDKDKIKLKEICYIKDGDGKKVIAKYHNDKKDDDNLIVSWDGNNSKPQVFTHKPKIPGFLNTRTRSEEPVKRAFRVHTFNKVNAPFIAKSNTPFSKAKRNKRVFKRLVSASTEANKIKKKLLKKKSRTDRN